MQNQIENLYKFILENNPIATNNINSTLDRDTPMSFMNISRRKIWDFWKN